MNYFAGLAQKVVDAVVEQLPEVANVANKIKIAVGEHIYEVPQNDVFQINGELSPNEFIRAGDHLIKICKGWQWKSSSNKENQTKRLTPTQQYLQLEKCLCKRRLNKTLQAPEVKEPEVFKEKEGDEEVDFYVLEAPAHEEQPEDVNNYRYYNMYIVYDEWYHTPRMYFSAVKVDQVFTPITPQDIRYDITRQYLDKTLTMEIFPFMEGSVIMPTVHPCRHAAVLKTISDSISQSGNKIQSHYALLIFLRFISGVIPYVEFDTIGDMVFA